MWNGDGFNGCTSTWRKKDCFADIYSAAAALIAHAERHLANKRTEVVRAISELDLARKWARLEAKILAEHSPTTVCQNAG
jgi:hypothetical protein